MKRYPNFFVLAASIFMVFLFVVITMGTGVAFALIVRDLYIKGAHSVAAVTAVIGVGALGMLLHDLFIMIIDVIDALKPLPPKSPCQSTPPSKRG